MLSRDTIHISDITDWKIEVKPRGFFRSPGLFVNGEPAIKDSRRGQFLLTRPNGKKAVAAWRPMMLGFDVSQLELDGERYSIVAPLPWHELAWCGVPFVLIAAGGALGGVIALLAIKLNLAIFRSWRGTMQKYLATGSVSLVAIVIYTLIAGMLFGTNSL